MIPQLTQLAALCLYALPAWLVLRSVWLMLRRPGRVKPLREVLLCLFVVFMTGILCMALEGQWAWPSDMLHSALERIGTGHKIHLKPLYTIRSQLQKLDPLEAATQLLGNTLLFVPWGFCLPLLWRRFRTPLRMIGMSLLLTCLIETTQLFIDRYVEIDDVLLNFIGSMLGAGVWFCLHRCLPGMDALILPDLK